MAGAIALAFFALAVVALVVDRSPSGPAATGPGVEAAAEREAFRAYEEAVEQAVQDGGFVVTQGLQPGVADIAEGAYDDEALVTMASGWLTSIERVRGELAAVEPPEFLAEADRLFDEALAGYVEVARTLLAAAEASGDDRAALIEEVPVLGERADEQWNAAQAELDRHRERLGLSGEEQERL